MERSARLVRRNLILAGLSCAFLAVVLLRPTQSAAVRSEADYPAAWPDFDPVKVRAIELSRKAKRDGKEVPERLRLTGSGDDWRIATAHDYPAMTSRVRTFLDKMREARVLREPTQNPERFPTYAGTDGFTEVRVLGEADAPLATFGIGTTNADNNWENVFLRLDAAASAPGTAGAAAKPAGRIVVASKFDTSASRADVASWAEQRVWPALARSEVLEISVEQPSKSRTIDLVRGKKAEGDADEPWTMTKPEEGKADASAVGNLLRAFVGLNLADVVDSATGAEADAKYGFDKPDVVVTAKGTPAGAPGDKPTAPTWRIVVGKKVEGAEVDRYYVRRATNGKEDGFVFAVSDFDLKDFRAEPATLLEKKPEPPAPAPGTEAPGMDAPGMDGAAMEDASPPSPPADGAPMDDAPMDDGPPPMPGDPPAGMDVPPPAPGTPPAPDPGMR
jgi:hypothetical protein